jgi:predicted transcriptional regulator
MTASTTMTIRVSADVKEKLGQLSRNTSRSRSFLAAEAIATYVDRELLIIEGVLQGMADVDAGNVVSHEEARAEVNALIDAVRPTPSS